MTPAVAARGTMHTVPVLLLLAGAVILAGVVAVAMGHGGEMAEFPSDYVPPTLGDLLTATDVAMLRPPAALWGYNTQVTDEALSRIAQIVTERDVEIAVLRQQLAEARSGTRAAPPAGRATLASAVLAGPEPAAAAEPVAPEPVTAEPEAAEPEAAEPALPEAEAALPEAETAEPEVAEPEVAEPEAAEPKAAEPKAAEAEAAEPAPGAAGQDDAPAAPAVPSDEAAVPGDD
jgi:hypothetical protein